jgi:hypothetical protein
LPALWVFVPVLGAPLAHVLVLRHDLLRPLKRPLDGGRRLRGKRLLGDHKTWRGAAVMTAGVFAAAHAGWRVRGYADRLPAPVRAAGPTKVGLLLGLGTVAGELPNSFAKRQLDIGPGERRSSWAGRLLSVYDQADLVPAIWLALLPVYRIPARQLAAAFAAVAAAHLGISVVGYRAGARTGVL